MTVARPRWHRLALVVVAGAVVLVPWGRAAEAQPADPSQGAPTTIPAGDDVPLPAPPPPEPGDGDFPPTPATVVVPPDVAVDEGDLGPKNAPGGSPIDPVATLDATFSFERWATPERAYPILVEVTSVSEEPIAGALHVTSTGEAGETILHQPIEVAPGATERHWLLAPADSTGFRHAEVRLVDDAGRIVAQDSEDLLGGEDNELVGLLPGVFARHDWPESWRFAPVENTGLVVALPLEPDMLDLGPLSLDPLDQVVGTASELADLGDDRFRAVSSWIQAGGQLLVVGDPAPLADLLPEGWAPSTGGSVRASLGTVRSVGQDWYAAMLPSPTRSVVEEGMLADSLRQSDPAQMEIDLVRESSATLKPARRVWAGLVAYVLVVGPVAFLVLRLLHRPRAAWLAVPAVAVLATTVTLTAGSSLADDVSSTEVTVYETGPAGTQAITWAVLADEGGGDVTAHLPQGWTAVSQNYFSFAASGAGQTTVQPGEDGQEVRVPAHRDSYGYVQAYGQVPDMDEALVVTAASSEDGIVHGTVTNHLDVALHDVVVLTGRTAAIEVGTLDPGQEHDLTLEGVTDFVWADQPEPGMWSGDALAVETWSRAVRRTGWNYRPQGQLVAVGWTDELPAPMEPGAGTADVALARSAVVARATVTPEGDRLSDAAVTRSYLRGPGAETLRLAGRDPNRPQDEAFADRDERGILGVLYGFELPPEVGDRPVDPDRLVLCVPDRFDAAEVWTRRGWQRLAVPEPGGGEIAVPLPTNAVVGGRVLVRAAVPFAAATPEPGRELTLYESEQP